MGTSAVFSGIRIFFLMPLLFAGLLDRRLQQWRWTCPQGHSCQLRSGTSRIRTLPNGIWQRGGTFSSRVLYANSIIKNVLSSYSWDRHSPERLITGKDAQLSPPRPLAAFSLNSISMYLLLCRTAIPGTRQQIQGCQEYFSVDRSSYLSI